ncbi:c-type cytochrome [Pseudobacteriovorax antillogorgiicola]|uniref:Cytochrome C oxidase, cbb3-type, subunit III n=1 Tax=Pseudobacteriovorax antillogorgiicola TaxID=1513793 RepID=A0A1Y6BMU1_9BACT|nr:cytochrome c [Pseudobacteriovorax antillogorgiicola]TCS54519.1 cbb3-type cytochrome c oxidase subunit III [Pseudobacteriovorax antillogorgiicola]SMF18871.1 Cytochrome C oxidase, cbb3-type, subunit III [Pseudobacteriovorax antillogorgiicola]
MIRLKWITGSMLLALWAHDFQAARAADTNSHDEQFTLMDGELLYQRHCALCHGSFTATLKKDRSPEQIQWAIANIPVMALRDDLSQLSDEKISAIAMALSTKADPLKSKNIRLANRFIFASQLKTWFQPDLPKGSPVKAVIRRNISHQGAQLGGSCLPRELENCGVPVIEATMSAQSQVVRQGLIFKACEEVLDRDEAVTYFLGLAGINPSATVTQTSMTKASLLLNKDRPLPQGSVEALISLSNAAYRRSAIALDRWRFPLLIICQSPYFEIL